MPEPPLTRDAVIDLVRKAEIVDDDVLSSFMSHSSLPPTASDTATRLIQAGLLTPFQARLILQGRYRGFRLGPYRILDQIGAGGMGQVFLAEHTTMRRRVALKVLPPKQAADRVGVERFYREARAAAALDHPNIVRAHDVGFDRGSHYLVLEYVEGIDLGNRMKELGGRLPVGEAVAYAVQAAAGLQHAHEKGIVHRDIKPQNLLVDREGVLKILDMGLARFFEDEDDKLTAKLDGGGVMGTADYVSPEQLLDSSNIDHRADIYSLGATMYHLLTGTPPFSGNTTAKLVAHQLMEAPPVCEVCDDIPEEVSDVVEKMMEKDADDRYQTAADIIPELLPYVGDPRRGPGSSGKLPALAMAGLGQSTANLAAAMHAAALQPPPPSAASRKKTIALLALGGVLLVGGLVVALVIALQPDDRPVDRIKSTPEFTPQPAAAAQAISVAVGPVNPTLAYPLQVEKVSVESAVFTPDGKKLITCGGDKAVRVWDAANGQPIRTMEGHTGNVRGLSLLPGGKRVLSSSADKTIKMWEVETGDLVRTYEGHTAYVTNVAALPNGRRFLSSTSEGDIWLWDVDTMDVVMRYPPHPTAVFGLAVTRDGRRAVAATWDPKRHNPKTSPAELAALPPAVVWAFDIETGREIRRHGIATSASHVSLSANGQYAAFGTADGLATWDIDNNAPVRNFTGAAGRVTGTAFTRDGNYILATGHGKDGSSSAVYVWHKDGKLAGSEPANPGAGYQVSLSADGKKLASVGANGGASVWNLPAAVVPGVSGSHPHLVRLFTGHTAELEDAMFTADGRRVVAGSSNNSIRVWDADTGEQVREFSWPGKRHRSMALLSGNRLVTVDAEDPVVRTWNLDSGTELRQFVHDEGVISVAAMPGGKQFLTCGGRQAVRMWDADTGDEVGRFDPGGVDARGLAVTPDGKFFVLGGNDKSVRLWDVAKKTEVRRMALTTVPWRIGVSPDSKTVGVGNGNNLVLWNVETFETKSLAGAAAFVDGVAFSKDGRHVFATAGNSVSFWEAATGTQLSRQVEHRGGVRDVRCSPDGASVVTSSVDGTAMLWRLPTSMQPKADPKK